MIKIEAMPRQIEPRLLDALASVQTVDVGHFRLWGVMDPELRPVCPNRRIVGTAVTMIIPAFDSALVPYVMGMVRPGDVLVIDRLGDRRHSCLGGTVALAAKMAGVAGIVVDGLATDFEDIQERGLPVWCRGRAALTTKLLAIGGAINVPVCCGGVAVTPGDAILADDYGIVVLKDKEIEETVEKIRNKDKGSADRVAQLLRGESLPKINGVGARVDAVLAKQTK